MHTLTWRLFCVASMFSTQFGNTTADINMQNAKKPGIDDKNGETSNDHLTVLLELKFLENSILNIRTCHYVYVLQKILAIVNLKLFLESCHKPPCLRCTRFAIHSYSRL